MISEIAGFMYSIIGVILTVLKHILIRMGRAKELIILVIGIRHG